MKLSFFWINFILIGYSKFGSSTLTMTCETLKNSTNASRTTEESHKVRLKKWFKVSCVYKDDVHSIISIVKRPVEGYYREGNYTIYIKKFILGMSAKNLTDKPSEWKSEDQYTIEADEKALKLAFLVDCTDHDIQIQCIYKYKCPASVYYTTTSHTLSVIDLDVIEKQHHYLSSLSKLAVNFSMCPSVRYASIKVTGFGKRDSISMQYDKSKLRSKVITVIYESYGLKNCLYDDHRIIFQLYLSGRTERYTIYSPSSCGNPKVQVYFILFLIIVYFFMGCGPVLLSRRRWYRSMVELDSLKTQLKCIASTTKARLSRKSRGRKSK